MRSLRFAGRTISSALALATVLGTRPATAQTHGRAGTVVTARAAAAAGA